MPKHFYKHIKLHVDQKVTFTKKASKVRKQGNVRVKFSHLENAYML
jgi:predicted transposase YbfD/YdcC